MTQGKDMTRRVALATVGTVGAGTLLAEFATGQQGDAKKDEGYKTIAELNLSEPIVSINGPFPTVLRGAKVGQLIQVQISFPISPPFPTSAKVEPDSDIFSVIGVYRTEGEIAILTPKPKQGAIGVGFLSVFVTAKKAGKGNFTVKVKLDGGTVKSVPFAFNIGNADK
ncbi:MAG: hypothetical protein JWM11_6206 [Planctomycetaceae bacterium]|nr:hypothetical protein [Planctomycetaceae bacterium]